ncbi:hypothetical protein BDF20DRAFT_903547 [Mycotypha africana]|uniref:uncharacterized protein n=1 Tax=Mycotypha africana TaxID=64632 RepID=UPI002300E1EA|nr:uncharacterized protein BDF20DRAFT_903547 [Mycotypha africana]KAI8966914.1 hypothetical protein BDF20DRAFT_903547 [Mycotypha africana]
MYLPASRSDRSRLVRWRMGWIPGKPKSCPCGLDHTSRRHLTTDCPKISFDTWLNLPLAPMETNLTRVDHALNDLPTSASATCPSYWVTLCRLLWTYDTFCNPEGDYSTDPDPGAVWLHLNPPAVPSIDLHC